MYNNNTPPSTIWQQQGVEEDVEMGNRFPRLLCCFWKPRSTSALNFDDEDKEYLMGRRYGVGSDQEAWLVRNLKKVRDISEMVAGPKWKNFIRRVGAYFKGKKRRMTQNNTQYDPFDYALNFDDGKILDDQDRFRFSTRYAPPSLRDS